MPRNNFDKDSKGVVLVIVLVLFMALSSLTLMTIEVSSRGAVEASRMRNEYEAGFKAEEALYMAYDLLKDDKTPFSDTPRERWVRKFKDDGLEIEIIPCNAKINANDFVRRRDRQKSLLILGRMLGRGMDVKSMAGSLSIWIGVNINSKLAKMDNFFYSSQFPAYSPRGSYLKTPEEILLVRGWSDLGREWVDDHFTVWGSGKININFASRETLLAYLPELGKRVDSIMHWRRTRGFTDISQVLSVTGLSADSDTYLDMSNNFGVNSKYFEVKVGATVGDCTVVKRYIISRDNSLEIGECSLVYQNDLSVTFAEDQ
ncbi:general secretion pathway protein GspK [Desulfovibrio sp. JC022]|uniref:general secretion pathway protein GspK n=1 Tax=Desulfovibrio sp. JC022 TaxID=2593642 RepID=UPI0013D4E14B|nr:type II secretion system protein GspK [Desulfovibrio sp. JC022]NDV22195.1 general secretion pathway protein GspK [Desulfovibrio sp. JC022]